MDDALRDEFQKTLETERERLASEVAEMERAGAENLSDATGENNYRDHMADQGTATFTRELDMSLVDATRHLLDDVDLALVRVEDGSYGVCTRCGETIPESRLRAVPAAGLCVSCKEREETS